MVAKKLKAQSVVTGEPREQVYSQMVTLLLGKLPASLAEDTYMHIPNIDYAAIKNRLKSSCNQRTVLKRDSAHLAHLREELLNARKTRCQRLRLGAELKAGRHLRSSFLGHLA